MTRVHTRGRAAAPSQAREPAQSPLIALPAKLERPCLCFDPFSGDRDSDARQLRDRFVTTRFTHKCSYCFTETIPAGTRVRALTEASDEEGKVMTFYFCVPCCHAMATVHEDDGAALDERARLAWKAARRSRR